MADICRCAIDKSSSTRPCTTVLRVHEPHDLLGPHDFVVPAIGHHPHLSLEAARTRARAVLADVDAGKDPVAAKLKTRRPDRSNSFAHVVDDYIQKYAQPRNRSWRETEATLHRYFVPIWKSISLQSMPSVFSAAGSPSRPALSKSSVKASIPHRV